MKYLQVTLSTRACKWRAPDDRSKEIATGTWLCVPPVSGSLPNPWAGNPRGLLNASHRNVIQVFRSWECRQWSHVDMCTYLLRSARNAYNPNNKDRLLVNIICYLQQVKVKSKVFIKKGNLHRTSKYSYSYARSRLNLYSLYQDWSVSRHGRLLLYITF